LSKVESKEEEMQTSSLIVILVLTLLADAVDIERFEPIGTALDDPLFNDLRKWADGLASKEAKYSTKLGVGLFTSYSPDKQPVSVRGLMALDDIRPQEVLVSFPLPLVVNDGPMIEDSKWEQIFIDNTHLEQYQRFALFLLLLADENPQKYRPYLDILSDAPLGAIGGMIEA
jgi:hypothetical protein